MFLVAWLFRPASFVLLAAAVAWYRWAMYWQAYVRSCVLYLGYAVAHPYRTAGTSRTVAAPGVPSAEVLCAWLCAVLQHHACSAWALKAQGAGVQLLTTLFAELCD